MFITKWGKWLLSHIDCEHTQYRQFYKRWNSYIQAQWQIQDFMLSSQTGTQSSLSPGSLAQLTPSFLSFSTKIFSNQEMHVHIFLLFLALFCIASVPPKNFPGSGAIYISSASHTVPKVYNGRSLPLIHEYISNMFSNIYFQIFKKIKIYFLIF